MNRWNCFSNEHMLPQSIISWQASPLLILTTPMNTCGDQCSGGSVATPLGPRVGLGGGGAGLPGSTAWSPRRGACIPCGYRAGYAVWFARTPPQSIPDLRGNHPVTGTNITSPSTTNKREE